MRYLTLLGSTVFTVALACAPSGTAELTDAMRATIADTVRAESSGWKSAVERADANAVLSYYADAPETVIIRSDQSMISFEEFKSRLGGDFQGTRSQTMAPRSQRIDVLARDVAAESAVGDWMSTDTAGKVENGQFAFTRVWARRDGKWRIVHTYIDVRPVATPTVQAATRK